MAVVYEMDWVQIVTFVVALLVPFPGLFFGVDAYLRKRSARTQAWPPVVSGVIALPAFILAVWNLPLPHIVTAIPLSMTVIAAQVLLIAAIAYGSAPRRRRDPQPLARGLFITGILLGVFPWLGLALWAH